MAERASRNKNSPSRNLFIAGFKLDMDDEKLRSLFASYGPIESAKVMLDIHTSAPRGFAFVLFERLEDAINAQRSTDGQLFRLQNSANRGSGHSATEQFRLTVEFAKHDAFNVATRSAKVYCRNIPTTLSEAQVIQALEEVTGPGSIVTIAVLPDSARSPALFERRRGAGRGLGERATGNVAFVEFSSVDEAQRAIDLTYRMQLDGPGSQGPLMTKFAETAEVRAERKKRHEEVPPPAQPPPPPAPSPSAPPQYQPPGYALNRELAVTAQPSTLAAPRPQQVAHLPAPFVANVMPFSGATTAPMYLPVGMGPAWGISPATAPPVLFANYLHPPNDAWVALPPPAGAGVPTMPAGIPQANAFPHLPN
jgi:hypothetical protein